jgi:hypothetical protein
VAYVRAVKTSSGATAVQIVHSSRGSRKIEHLGSAHTPEEVEALKVAARQRIDEGQAELDLGLEVAAAAGSGGPLEIAGSRATREGQERLGPESEAAERAADYARAASSATGRPPSSRSASMSSRGSCVS